MLDFAANRLSSWAKSAKDGDKVEVDANKGIVRKI